MSKSSEQVGKISEQVRILLTLAVGAPRSRGEMLQAIGLTDAYGNYRRHLVPLLERGYLARTVPDRPNSRNQRYVTTSDGRQLLGEEAK